MLSNAAYDRHGRQIENGLAGQIKRSATSVTVLILAFIASNVILRAITWAAARFAGLLGHFTYNNVYLTKDWHHWGRTKILIVYLSPPVACLLLSLLLFRLLLSDTKWINISRLFLFWLMVCLGNLFLAHLAISPIGVNNYSSGFYDYFAVVAAWLGIGATVMIVGTILSVLASIIMGIVVGKEVWRYSFSQGLITAQWGKNTMVFQVFIVPVLLGFVPLLALSDSTSVIRNALIAANLIFMAIGMLIRNSLDHDLVKCDKRDVLNHFPLFEICVTAAVWISVFVFWR